MPIIKDIEIRLDPRKIAREINRGRENRSILEGLKRAVERAAGLAAPQALYELVEVAGVEGERVRVTPQGGGPEVSLKVGPKADLMARASLAVVSVATLGPALEAEVARINKTDGMLESYLLDSVGVTALGEVGRAVRDEVERLARDKGFGVGPSLAPGSLAGWPTSGQRELLSLLDLERIGVELNTHFLLRPMKSASGLIGLGAEYTSTRVGSVCQYCSLAPTCWRRRDNPH